MRLPGSARFRVGNTVRDWKMGQAWVFDDTIEHEAWNDSTEMRVILLIEIWRPELTAAERAGQLGRNACEAAQVIWLDQSVHATGIRLRRNEDGKLGFERTFRFDYSHDGSDRSTGRLVLRGDRLIAFTGPATERPNVLDFPPRQLGRD